MLADFVMKSPRVERSFEMRREGSGRRALTAPINPVAEVIRLTRKNSGACSSCTAVLVSRLAEQPTILNVDENGPSTRGTSSMTPIDGAQFNRSTSPRLVSGKIEITWGAGYPRNFVGARAQAWGPVRITSARRNALRITYLARGRSPRVPRKREHVRTETVDG